jgi:hypothetical protein
MKRTIWIAVIATIALLALPGAIHAARQIHWGAWFASFPVRTFDHPLVGWAALAVLGLAVLVGLLPRGRERRIVGLLRHGCGVAAIARRMDLAQDAVRGLLGPPSLVPIPVPVGPEERSGRKGSPPPRRPRPRAGTRGQRKRGDALRAELRRRKAGGTPLAARLAASGVE